MYMRHRSGTNCAFAAAMAPLLGSRADQLEVTKSAAAPLPTNGTVLFFELTGAAAAASSMLASLFASAAPGSPALPALLSALSSEGLHFEAFASNGLPAPPPPVAGAATNVQGQQLAFSIYITDWQEHSFAYNPAVQSALADVMGIESHDVWIFSNRVAANGGTIVVLDIAQSFVSSEVSIVDYKGEDRFMQLPHAAMAFAQEFGAGDPWNVTVGDAASPALIAAFRRYGLPVTEAFCACGRLFGKIDSDSLLQTWIRLKQNCTQTLRTHSCCGG